MSRIMQNYKDSSKSSIVSPNTHEICEALNCTKCVETSFKLNVDSIGSITVKLCKNCKERFEFLEESNQHNGIN